jgi:hypothetical protein
LGGKLLGRGDQLTYPQVEMLAKRWLLGDGTVPS